MKGNTCAQVEAYTQKKKERIAQALFKFIAIRIICEFTVTTFSTASTPFLFLCVALVSSLHLSQDRYRQKNIFESNKDAKMPHDDN